ncbi:MAG TPA: aldo/keto reductase [Dehalococcoidia bacterium]
MDAHGLSLPQVAVAWVLRNPRVTSAIVGATSPGQLDQTLPSTDVALSDEVGDACASA